MTYLIMFLINLVPGLKFRASEEAEIVGMDEVELGEYVADYAFVDRDLEGAYQHPAFKDHYAIARSKTRGDGRSPSIPPGAREPRGRTPVGRRMSSHVQNEAVGDRGSSPYRRGGRDLNDEITPVGLDRNGGGGMTKVREVESAESSFDEKKGV